MLPRRAYVAQHRALWRCAREQIATLEEKMAIAVVATIGPTLGRLQAAEGLREGHLLLGQRARSPD